MPGSHIYDLMYRFWAPWDSAGVRTDLMALVDSGRVAAATHPRAIDLGCGTGANVVYLGQQGFEAVGVDFSVVALEKARLRAARAGVSDRCRFVKGDLTANPIAGINGPFDLVVDFGTLDDLDPEGRRAMADNIARLARPGATFLFWCFYASTADLPRISFSGPSRMAPGVEPGEEAELFGAYFVIEPFSPPTNRMASFVLTRRRD